MNELTQKVLANLAARMTDAVSGSVADGARGPYGQGRPEGGKYAALRGGGKGEDASRDPARGAPCSSETPHTASRSGNTPFRDDAPAIRHAPLFPGKGDVDGTRMMEKAKALHDALRGERMKGGAKRGAESAIRSGAQPGDGAPASGTARDLRYAAAGMVSLGELASMKK